MFHIRIIGVEVEKTVISISIELRNKLKAIGKKGQTYNDIIELLLQGDKNV